jgi:hypothetical protein
MPAYNICRGKEMHGLLCLRRDRGASCTQNIGDLDAPKEHHS